MADYEQATAYTAWNALKDRFSGRPARAEEMERLTCQAIGYVWGFKDAGGVVKDPERGTEFGYAFGVVVARSILFTSARPAIQDAWSSWQTHGNIRNYNGRRLDIFDVPQVPVTTQ